KIGHINSKRLLEAMPSHQAALKHLEDLSIAGKKGLQELENELNKKIQFLSKNHISWTPLTLKKEQDELQGLTMAIEKKQEELEKQISQKNEELNGPILNRLQKAVDIVSERKNLNYVIDESVAIYLKDGLDITDEVMIELLKLDKAETGE